MVNGTTSRVHSSIDWLTVTASDPDKRDGLWNLGHELVKLCASRGDDNRQWNWKAYGGFHAGGVSVGRREDTDILQLSGPLADEWFDAAWLTANHCTRVDLAVTVWGGDELGNLASRHQAEVMAWKEATGRQIGVKTIYDEGRPSTLYLGRRESDLYARVYDKGLESGDPSYAGAWRYELEVKGQPAQRTASALHSGGARTDRTRHAVYQHFARRGAKPAFDCVGPELSIQTVRAPSDTATRLAWLASSVRPAVQRLLCAGHVEAVWEALGIPKTIAEKYRLYWLLARGTTDAEIDAMWEEA